MSLNVGVIGVGYLGQHHARIYAELEGVELAGISDIDPVRAEELAEKYNCRFFTDYKELINVCDALSIATPTTTHYAIAMECLKAGKDILIEKPITQNLDEAQVLIKTARECGRILQVGHLERYNPAISAAVEMINDPRFIESERLSPFLGRGIDVDVTIDLMIHDIDIIMSIVQSKIADIKATGEKVLTDKIDVAKAWLEFENGCKALITASRLAPEKKRKLRIFQKDSYISIDYQNQEVRRHFRKASAISFDLIKPETKEPLKEELKDFVRCVLTREKPLVSGEEGMYALDIALKITEMLKI